MNLFKGDVALIYHIGQNGILIGRAYGNDHNGFLVPLVMVDDFVEHSLRHIEIDVLFGSYSFQRYSVYYLFFYLFYLIPKLFEVFYTILDHIIGVLGMLVFQNHITVVALFLKQFKYLRKIDEAFAQISFLS